MHGRILATLPGLVRFAVHTTIHYGSRLYWRRDPDVVQVVSALTTDTSDSTCRDPRTPVRAFRELPAAPMDAIPVDRPVGSLLPRPTPLPTVLLPLYRGCGSRQFPDSGSTSVLDATRDYGPAPAPHWFAAVGYDVADHQVRLPAAPSVLVYTTWPWPSAVCQFAPYCPDRIGYRSISQNGWLRNTAVDWLDAPAAGFFPIAIHTTCLDQRMPTPWMGCNVVCHNLTYQL